MQILLVLDFQGRFLLIWIFGIAGIFGWKVSDFFLEKIDSKNSNKMKKPTKNQPSKKIPRISPEPNDP
jgi:hypothetical protein